MRSLTKSTRSPHRQRTRTHAPTACSCREMHCIFHCNGKSGEVDLKVERSNSPPGKSYKRLRVSALITPLQRRALPGPKPTGQEENTAAQAELAAEQSLHTWALPIHQTPGCSSAPTAPSHSQFHPPHNPEGNDAQSGPDPAWHTPFKFQREKHKPMEGPQYYPTPAPTC